MRGTSKPSPFRQCSARCVRCPRCARCAADAGFLTILVQDPEVAGLEVLGADGQWHLVTPIPGALTINVGDQAQVWRGGRDRAGMASCLELLTPPGADSPAETPCTRSEVREWGAERSPAAQATNHVLHDFSGCEMFYCPQVLTNDLIKAPLHRVRSPAGAKPRYSAPFFFNPRCVCVRSTYAVLHSFGVGVGSADLLWTVVGVEQSRRDALLR